MKTNISRKGQQNMNIQLSFNAGYDELAKLRNKANQTGKISEQDVAATSTVLRILQRIATLDN